MIHAPSRYAKTVRIIAPFAAICGLCYLFLVTFLPARFDPAATLSLRNRDPKQAPNSGIDRILVGGIQEQIQTASASSESSEINEGTIYDHDLLSGAHRDIIFEEYSFGYVTDRGSFDDNKEANNLNLPKGSDETDEEIKSKGNSQSTQDNQYEKEYHDGLDDLDDGYSSNSALEGVSQDLPLINQEISEDEQVIYEVEKANGVILMLTDEDQFQDTRETIRQVEDRFNRGRNYPWVILSPFPLTDRSQRLAKQLSKGNMRFGVIPHEQWRLPKWIDAARVRNNDYAKLKQGMNKTSLITRHRWRYMSGFVAEHELLDPYEFFWRVEPGVEMFCNIDEDPMLALKKSGQQFAWSLSSTVNEAGISSGLNIIQNFKKLHQDLITPSNDENFLVKGSKDGLSACTYGVENSVGRKDFFRSSGYKEYFKFIDQEGPIYYEKWNDAMVMTVGLSLLLERKDILFLKQHGWQRGQVAFCPKSCPCDPKLNSMPLHLSCTPFWMGLSDSPEMKRRVECNKNGKCTLHISKPDITIDI